MTLDKMDGVPDSDERQLVRTNHRLAVIGYAVLAAVLLTFTAYSAWSIYEAEIRAEADRVERDSLVVADLVHSLLDRYAFLAKSLLTNSRFTSVSNGTTEIEPGVLTLVSEKQARLISHYDHIDTWLQSEFGPSLSIPSENQRTNRVPLWKITRGLPIRSPKGALLAQPRRLLAEQVIREHPEILSIAELDYLDRVIFMTPYAMQVRLNAFNLSRVLALPLDRDANSVAVIAQRPSADAPRSSMISFLADGSRATGKFRILLTVRDDFHELASLAQQRTTVTLSRLNGDIVLVSGLESNRTTAHGAATKDSPPSFVSFVRFLRFGSSPEYAAIRSMQIQGGSYRLTILEHSTATPTALRQLLILVSTVTAVMLAFCVWRIRYSFDLITARQRELEETRASHAAQIQRIDKEVTSGAKELAHSYKNYLISLRASVDQLRANHDFDSEVKVDTVIHHLYNVYDTLSLGLVASAFAHAKVAGYKPPKPTSPATYLRGTLQYAVDHYRSRFGGNLTLDFAPDLDSQEPFISLNYTTLTTITNNILQNALEASTDGQELRAAIRVFDADGNMFIHFVNNGPPIPKEHHSKLFSGFSTKGANHGKGLQSSETLARHQGAELRLLHSEIGSTIFELAVNPCATPSWFASRIPLTNRSIVVVVDDEGGVGEYWENALKKLCSNITFPDQYKPKCIKLKSPGELERDEQGALQTGTVFLVDYQFAATERLNGIGLIESLGIQDRAILVTAHSDKPEVIDEVIKRGIRVLPKTYMYSARFRVDIGGQDE